MPKIYAHRGGAGYFVENTLKAFEFAIELGCAGAELDVHLTKDGEVVVHHDDKLNHKFARKPDGCWLTPEEELPLDELTLAEVQQYTVGEPNPKTHNHKVWPNLLPEPNQVIPTLSQAIGLAKNKSDSFEFVIEIKTDIFDTSQSWRPLVEAVLGVVKSHDFSQRVKFCSFNWNALLFIKENFPEYPLWFTTHPLSWLSDGEVPKTDIPPREETLHKIRQAWSSGNAPWYAGNQPKSLEDFPQVIQQLGGEAWFCYHTDTTVASLTTTHDQSLKLATWSVNLKDAGALEKLNLVDALCVDYPNYRFIKPRAEIKNFIATADQARKEKKWKTAEEIYQGIINDCSYKSTPSNVYSGLAISQRMQKKFDASEKTLSLAMSFFPNNASLYTELAALKNSQKKWNEAVLLWIKSYHLSTNFSFLNYKRTFLSLVKSDNLDLIKTFDSGDFKHILESKDILYGYVVYMLYKTKWQSFIFNLEKHYAVLDGFSEYSSKEKIQRYFKAYEIAINKILKGIPLGRLNNTQLVIEDIATIEAVIITNTALKHSDKIVLIKLLEKIASKAFHYGAHLGHKYIFSNLLIQLCEDFCSFLKETNGKNIFNSEQMLILANIALLAKDNDFYYELISQSFQSEQGIDLDSSNKYLLSEISNSRNSLSVHEVLLDLKKVDKFREINKKFIDQDYKNYISGKSIAIVGPVNNGIKNGNEIDNYDVVIRFNYRGGLDVEYFGEKTSVSLYADGPVKKKEIDPDVVRSINSLDWVIVGGTQQINFVKSVAKNSNLRAVFPCWRYNPLYKGTPNAVQKIIIDLILHGANIIKVFNATLWLSAKKIDGYHVGVNQAFESTMIRHDPLFNFMFLKSLYNEGVFQGDEALEDILDMPVKNYIKNL